VATVTHATAAGLQIFNQLLTIKELQYWKPLSKNVIGHYVKSLLRKNNNMSYKHYHQLPEKHQTLLHQGPNRNKKQDV